MATEGLDTAKTHINMLAVLRTPLLALVKAPSSTDTLMVCPLFPLHVSL
jgi:hypothetical protein